MATLESVFATDTEAEVGGKWVEIGPFKVKLARADRDANPRFARVSVAKWSPVLREAELGVLDAKAEARIVAEIYAETIVLDWQGVTGDDGAELPCSREAVIEKLLALPEFRKRIVAAATRFETFKAAQRESVAGF